MAGTISNAAVVEAVSELESGKKLERDKGIDTLTQQLGQLTAEDVPCLEAVLLSKLTEERWQSRHGGLLGCQAILLTKGTQVSMSQNFQDQLLARSLVLLDDREARVRLAAGEILGTLCRVGGGAALYGRSIEGHLLDRVRHTLKRDAKLLIQEVLVLRKKIGGRSYVRDENGDPGGDSSDGEDLTGEPIVPGNVDHLFHDTAGWKSLETNFRCLQQVMEACEGGFSEYLSPDFLQLVYTAVKHKNRFVRGTGFEICGLVVDCCKDEAQLMSLAHDLNLRLATGLADNWSTVRLSACIATRKFLLRLSPTDRAKMYPIIVPRMCINRYFVAEGVRSHTQQTWEMVMGMQGRSVVAQHIQETVTFYQEQSDADNHAVREAACICMAELAQKIDPQAVRPYVVPLLTTLLVCFRDESWPVRSRACVACGRLVRSFPEECRSHQEELYGLFFQHLSDTIWSVREDAALELGDMVSAYGQDAFDRVFAVLKENIESVKNQPRDAEAQDRGQSNHENSKLVSCEDTSSAPRPGEKYDHTYHRPAAPWEVSDGCIYLLRELAATHPKEIGPLLPVLAGLGHFRHYSHHTHLLQTMWKQLPVVAKALGKRPFKQYLEEFFEPLVYTLQCGNRLAGDAAGECVLELCTFLGRSIYVGRLEAANPSYVPIVMNSPFVTTQGPQQPTPGRVFATKPVERMRDLGGL
eukprot:comp19068_c0_seq1/m.21543 comp19068_c0_seq1/g.21543  ORF comp19068_c0_seq1/g.21543 comp19068_c0_seq1/m.21543 type:complete len:696 (-) comp19068_c0_seq1:466-2553(-)